MLFRLQLVGGQFFRSGLQRFSSQMAAQTVKVQVQQGVIIGRREQLSNGVPYHCFQGIPYAVPPLGELRFKSPVPLERFNVAELDCTRERSVSYQNDMFTRNVIGSEDCLFLNVYAPQSRSTQPLPVLVFIHGGGFMFGSGNSESFLPLSLMEEDVIVVTLNYRLGALGFLCFPEAGIWGNAGLKDQRLALQWLQENISNFNGDPKNVTLCGESAGAASVHLHAYSQHANKLFHKAILQSGTANMEWVFQQYPTTKTHQLSELLGYSKSQNPHEVLQFLQSPKATPVSILKNTLKVLSKDEKRRGLPLPFRPVVEDSNSPDSFLTTLIMERLNQHDTLAMPIIMGYNSAEGIALMVNAIRKLEIFDNDLARLLPRNIPIPLDDKEIQILTQKMRQFYFNGRALSPEVFDSLVALLGDYTFTVDVQFAAEIQARRQPRAPLYFYRFNYVGERNLFKRILNLDHLQGASHVDELYYQFQRSDDVSRGNAKDIKFTKLMCEMWANFARYGEPTPQENGNAAVTDFNWKPVKQPTSEKDTFVLDYLDIDKECKMKRNPDRERIEFWRNVYHTYKQPTDYSRLSAKL